MRLSVIDVADERRLAAEGLLPKAERKRVAALPVQTKWRVASLWARIVFFILTAVGMSWCYGFLRLFQLPNAPAAILVGVGSIALAEMLMRRANFFRTGIEEALYLGGLVSLILSLPSSGKPEAVIVFIIAFAWCGLRLAHGFFIGVATMLWIAYAAWKFESGVVGGYVSLALLLVAIIADAAPRKRPYAQFALNMQMLLLPTTTGFLICSSPTHTQPNAGLVGIIGVLSSALLAFAIVRGVRPLIASTTLNILITIGDLLARTRIADEALAIAVGASMLVGAILLERRLRGRERGLNGDKFEAKPLAGAIEMIATAAAGAAAHDLTRPSDAPAPAVEQASNGSQSSFGGGGATADY